MAVYKDSTTKTWYVQLWYKDFTGKRKHTTKSGFARKQDAEKWERDFKSTDHPERMSMKALITKFKDFSSSRVVLRKIRQTTYDTKMAMIDYYILPYFNDVDIMHVTTANINDWLTALAQRKTKRGDRLSSGTINIVKNVLSQIFEYGNTNRYCTVNPVKQSESVGEYTTDKRAKSWSLEEFNKFYASLVRDDEKVAVLIMFLAGLRVGEVCALTPGDITPKTITVVKTKVNQYGPTVINPPKTKSSKRTVIIPEDLYNAIKAYIASIPKIKRTDKIFNFTASNLNAKIRSRCKTLNLPKISSHTLRHSYASLLYALCKDLTVVSHQLGHANAKITAEIYAHMTLGEDEKAAEKLNNLVNLNSN